MILKTGNTLDSIRGSRGDFEDWIIERADLNPVDVTVLDARETDHYPSPRDFDAIFITGSQHAVHDREPFSERAADWIRDIVRDDRPTLGICYGHQLLAHALGGISDRNPNGREIGVHTVERVTDDALFDDLPERFPVIETHMDAVIKTPPNGTIIAVNEKTPIQALAVGRKVRSVQWHPEFDADIIRAYIRERRDMIDAESGDGTAAKLEAAVYEVDTGPILLRNFLEHFVGS